MLSGSTECGRMLEDAGKVYALLGPHEPMPASWVRSHLVS